MYKMEVGKRERDREKRDITGMGRWQKVALGQLEGIHTEGLLKLTYLSTGLWLWTASYGLGRNCIVQSQRKTRSLNGEERGARRIKMSPLQPNFSK